MKKRLKIAMLIDGWDPIFGGGQIHVQQLSEHLIQKHDCTVDIFVRKLKDAQGKEFVKNQSHINGRLKILRVGPTTKFFNLFGRIASLIATTYRLYQEAKKNKYDIIHAHAYVSGVPGKIVSLLLGIPIVYTVHGTMLLDAGKKSIFYYVEHFLVNIMRYDTEISVSGGIKKYKNYNNIVIIPNGVDVSKFETIPKNQGIPGYRFLWVGRFDWQKGLEFLIEAIGKIERNLLKEKEFQLILVGDGEERKKIEGLVKKYELEDYIFFKGKLFGEDLIYQYKNSDIFILPSLAEGQPLTLLEAFAAKLPVIVTKVGDNSVFVKENNGFLLEPGNQGEIKEIIEKVLKTDRLKLKELGGNGYQLVKRFYSWDVMTQRTFDQYILLIQRNSGEQ